MVPASRSSSFFNYPSDEGVLHRYRVQHARPGELKVKSKHYFLFFVRQPLLRTDPAVPEWLRSSDTLLEERERQELDTVIIIFYRSKLQHGPRMNWLLTGTPVEKVVR